MARTRKSRSGADAQTPPPDCDAMAQASNTPSGSHGALLEALLRLDALLGVAVDHQARMLGPASLMDPWRLGMHLSHDEVKRLLEQQGHRSLTSAGDVAGLLASAFVDTPGLSVVTRALGLDDIDLAALLIALAPDVDLRYERIFGYLQDDINRKRPSLDLIANLLAIDAERRVAVCAHFGRNAPLLRHSLLTPIRETAHSPLAQDYRVDPVWRSWLMGADVEDALPNGSQPIYGRETLETLALEPDTRKCLDQACELASLVPLRLWLHGEHGAGKLDTACAIAHRSRCHLLPLDLRDASSAADVTESVQRAALVASLFGGVLYIRGIGRLDLRDPQLLRSLMEALAAATSHIVVSCVTSPPAVHGKPLPLLRVGLLHPTAAARMLLWKRALSNTNIEVDDEPIATLAARFSLSRSQIGQAVAEASVLAMTQNTSRLGFHELATAVRQQCGGELAKMATRIVPRAGFSDLVAPAEVRNQLREICARVATRDTVAHEWAKDSVHARSTGVTALFVGPLGTGKTLSAEALANELGLDLYRIDLAGIISKYIGETEKNLDRVFAAAAHANSVLFFDEADALFGKRSEVKDAHDRYANIEVAYLLQKMEQFDGLAILATNLKQNLDEAFARRLTFTVNFPFPEEAERRLLWETLWPPHAPRGADVDLAWFAREYRLSGGNICNTVMAAAHLAAADAKVVMI